ncbi:hypothetical protein NUACC26_063160 [Scytonema sp. NUACC26]
MPTKTLLVGIAHPTTYISKIKYETSLIAIDIYIFIITTKI